MYRRDIKKTDDFTAPFCPHAKYIQKTSFSLKNKIIIKNIHQHINSSDESHIHGCNQQFKAILINFMFMHAQSKSNFTSALGSLLVIFLYQLWSNKDIGKKSLAENRWWCRWFMFMTLFFAWLSLRLLNCLCIF